MCCRFFTSRESLLQDLLQVIRPWMLLGECQLKMRLIGVRAAAEDISLLDIK